MTLFNSDAAGTIARTIALYYNAAHTVENDDVREQNKNYCAAMKFALQTLADELMDYEYRTTIKIEWVADGIVKMYFQDASDEIDSWYSFITLEIINGKWEITNRNYQW